MDGKKINETKLNNILQTSEKRNGVELDMLQQ